MDNITLETRMSDALEIAMNYGSIDGAHHKMWVIDQMVRALTSDVGYVEFVYNAKGGDDEPGEYEWDGGIAP